MPHIDLSDDALARVDAAFDQAEAIFLEAGDTGAGKRGQAEMNGARGGPYRGHALDLNDEKAEALVRELTEISRARILYPGDRMLMGESHDPDTV